jgi:hypothetical protein
MQTDWPSENIELRRVDELVPYVNNARMHSLEQVEQIAASITEWGWTTPVLVDEDGGIIAGHGRVLAALKLNIPQVPTMTALGWSDEQKKAYIIADNQIPQNAEWNDELLAVELGDLRDVGFNLDLLGWPEGVPEFAEMPDYSILETTDLSGQLDELALGVKKAIQIEFEAEDYAEAQELVQFWRMKKVQIGQMLIEKLREEKDAL